MCSRLQPYACEAAAMRYLRRRADAAAAWVWEGEPGGVEMHLAEVVAGVGRGLRLRLRIESCS